MKRFTAPQHTTAAHLSIGSFAVKGGILEVPDDTPSGDIGGLQANGFKPEQPAAPAPAAPLTAKE